jgi:hypothetical protein
MLIWKTKIGYNSESDEDDDLGEVAASWLSPADKSDEQKKKSALTHMEPARDEPRKELSIEEEETERRYMSYLQKAQTADLSQFDKLNVVYHSGKDSEGRPIVVICPCRLSDPLPDMEKFLLYLLRVLDPLVNSNYVLIYFHSHMNDREKPDFSWLKNVYEILSWKYSRNLSRFFVVHPTFFLKIVNTFFKAFASADFFEKVTYLDSLTELFDYIPRTQLNVVQDVYEYDRIENGVLWSKNTAISEQHSTDL